MAPARNFDVLVLGAGMVGVCAAVHLQKRGRAVALIDRQPPGEATSYGNAGLIERASILPYTFPRELEVLLRAASNRGTQARYHVSALPKTLPWLARYFAESSPEGIARTAAAALPLITRCLAEHEALMGEAGALDLLRRTGWIKLYKSEAAFAHAPDEVATLRPYGLNIDVLDAAALEKLEPNVSGAVGGVHYLDPGFVPDPGALVKAYERLFERLGGRFVAADARRLGQTAGGWQVEGADGPVTGATVVVALGPWSDDVFRPLGYAIPLGVKRGYHMHYGPSGNAVLNHPVLDIEGGYVLAPMNQGVRLTTGAEFALRDAEPTPVQLERDEPLARALFPLGPRLDAKPWMGARPCLPDMLPVIGPAGRHAGLWFDFGHQHHGLTLGPVTGRLLAEMVTGEAPFCDPAPYRAGRF